MTPHGDTPPPDDDVEHLFRQERLRPGPSLEARARLDARVAATLGPSLSTPPAVEAPAASPHSPAALGSAPVSLGLGKVAASLAALTLAVGTTLAGLALRTSPVPIEPTTAHAKPPEHAPEAAPPVAPAAVAAPNRPPKTANASRQKASAATPPIAPRPSEPDGDSSTLAEERAFIQQARNALAANDARQALVLLDRLRARFPAGVLVEEREVLRIVALLQAGEDDRARSLAAGFRTRHPDSLFSPALDGALGQAAQGR